MKKALILLCFSWLLGFLKHLTILPVVDWSEHEITGIEFKLRF